MGGRRYSEEKGELTIRWLARALQDRVSQLAYIAERNAMAAENMDGRIRSGVALLAEHPMMGRSGRVPGTRELPIGGSPFLVVYRIDRGQVRIVRLLHGAQQWPPA